MIENFNFFQVQWHGFVLVTILIFNGFPNFKDFPLNSNETK